MNQALLLSLGHNSSAIYFDGDKPIGYETERLDRVKSSSASPILAIKQIEKFVEIPKETPIFITNWFDYFQSFPENKYSTDIKSWALDKGSIIHTHTEDFTHHDAHAWSAISFFKYHVGNTQILIEDQEVNVIVADGFGNFQETISIYSMKFGEDLKLLHRVYGYETSLGLFYQYATDFCGMKMNQDEYKFLGYESLFQSFFTHHHSLVITGLADKIAEDFIIAFKQKTELRNSQNIDFLIDTNHLMFVRKKWHQYFELCLNLFKIEDKSSSLARVLIANVIQRVVEKTLSLIIDSFSMKNVLLAGGIFYNVKLNNSVLKKIPGFFSVVPLAGDQGASIGFYEKYLGQFNWNTLAFGKRESHSLIHDTMSSNKNTIYPKTEEECVEAISFMLKNDQIVNLVRSNMEYGPRALGYTSSLFQPSQENCNFVNYINDRNEVMPMAPMILGERMKEFFAPQYNRVIGSDQFMILTYDYRVGLNDFNKGVMHNYPENNNFSGRPQVITEKDKLMYSIMKNYGVNCHRSLLTNTSYNYHGEPIVYSLCDILKTHYKQLKRVEQSSKKKKVNLVIYDG